MYTYQFNYSSSVDGFGTIQFCSYTKKEATDLFESWQAENGYNIPEYTVQTVYNVNGRIRVPFYLLQVMP